MKLALIADIHANLPAFEAVLADIDRRGIDRILCLGDMVGKGPHPAEVFDLCMARCAENLIGNWEFGITHAARLGQEGEPVHPRMRWNIDRLGPQRLAAIARLPHSCTCTLSGRLVRMFHAHPRDFSRYFADSALENRLELFEPPDGDSNRKPSDVAVYGDIHHPYLQLLRGRMILNTGSVGNPLDITQASYLLLEGDPDDPAAPFTTAFVRLPYDIERTIAEARREAVPDLEGYIAELREARYFRRTPEN